MLLIAWMVCIDTRARFHCEVRSHRYLWFKPWVDGQLNFLFAEVALGTIRIGAFHLPR